VHEGPTTAHFDGERFHNEADVGVHGMGGLLRWMLNRDQGYWRDWVESPPGTPPPTRLGGGPMRVTFVNHATALIQSDGLNVLVDPVWSDVVGPGGVIGNRRHRPPGLRFEDLPPIDVVLVSHDHYDHMDLPTLRRLAEEHSPLIVTGLGNGAYLEDDGIPNTRELDWWQSTEVSDEVSITLTPAQHFSQRGLRDRNQRLWAGFVLEGPSGVVFYAGDTGYAEHFAEVRERFGEPRLALLPIGMFRPRWFMCGVHMSPADAVLAHRDLGARRSVGVHWGTFALADDGELEPLEELHAALAPAEQEAFWVLGHGEGRDVP